MRKTITLNEETEVGNFHQLANGVTSRVWANEFGAVVMIGAAHHEFTSASDLRTLASKLLTAADVIEGV
jgi:hypothetical protein